MPDHPSLNRVVGGLVPFTMAGVIRRPLPDLPGISAFHELNVRLYVEHQGRPGVWFLSLDAPNPLAVWAARRFFHLPYCHAGISLVEANQVIQYHSQRRGGAPALDLTFGPTSAPYESRPGTLEHWLTERYCLYAQAPDRSLWRTDVHHVPWPLQQADADITENTYLSSHGLDVSGPPAQLHFARRLDVIVWNPQRVA